VERESSSLGSLLLPPASPGAEWSAQRSNSSGGRGTPQREPIDCTAHDRRRRYCQRVRWWFVRHGRFPWTHWIQKRSANRPPISGIKRGFRNGRVALGSN